MPRELLCDRVAKSILDQRRVVRVDQHKAGGGSKVLAAGAGGRLPGAVYSCVAIADHSSDTRSLAESMRARLSAGMLSAVRGAHRRSRPSNNCEAHQLTARGRDSRDSVHLLVGCGKHNVQRCWTCMRRNLRKESFCGILGVSDIPHFLRRVKSSQVITRSLAVTQSTRYWG